MYYCLTSKRVIGNYTQNISSYQRHSPVNEISGNTNPLLNLHTSVRQRLEAFDGTWSKGSLEWLDIQAHDDFDNTLSPYNQPSVTGIITLMRPEDNTHFKTTTFRIKNIGLEQLTTAINALFFNLTGLDLTQQSVKNTTFITNAVLIIHPKEDNENANV